MAVKAGGVGAAMDLVAMLIIVGQAEIRFQQEISGGRVSAVFPLHRNVSRYEYMDLPTPQAISFKCTNHCAHFGQRIIPSDQMRTQPSSHPRSDCLGIISATMDDLSQWESALVSQDGRISAQC
jgi:hypothetical protein